MPDIYDANDPVDVRSHAGPSVRLEIDELGACARGMHGHGHKPSYHSLSSDKTSNERSFPARTCLPARAQLGELVSIGAIKSTSRRIYETTTARCQALQHALRVPLESIV